MRTCFCSQKHPEIVITRDYIKHFGCKEMHSAKMFKLLLVISFCALVASLESTVHWQWRELDCVTKDGKGPDKIAKEPAECSVSLLETAQDENPRSAPDGNCFDETINGTTGTLCNLLCPNADTVYLIKRDPQVHRSCFVFYTHKLVHRGDDWFLWREKKCRNSQIKFTIRCEFAFARSKFPEDEDVFRAVVKTV